LWSRFSHSSDGFSIGGPSVTVLTEDGRTVGLKVEEEKNLEDVNVGDKVEITYTEAVMISVK
jgi:hypothetical protein